MSSPHKSFWSGIPSLVTGLAGVLTALVGLGALLLQLGVIGGKDSSSPSTGPASSGAATGATGAGGATATTAARPSFNVDPGNVTLSALSKKTATVTVTNQGEVPLKVKTPTVDGTQSDQFEVAAKACTSSAVASGGSCDVTVTFKGLIAADATMTVTADGATPATVDLKGTV